MLDGNSLDWLGNYMNSNGTWNNPIILLENSAGTILSHSGEALKAPFHLLEGHHRRAYLAALDRRGKALQRHEVWIACKL